MILIFPGTKSTSIGRVHAKIEVLCRAGMFCDYRDPFFYLISKSEQTDKSCPLCKYTGINKIRSRHLIHAYIDVVIHTANNPLMNERWQCKHSDVYVKTDPPISVSTHSSQTLPQVLALGSKF